MLRRIVGTLVLATVATSLVVGCGKLPTGPQAPSTLGTPQTGVEADGLISSVIDPLAGLIVKTVDLVGSLGGSLTNGRWKVAIPSGAVDGTATVALGVSSATSESCQLEIYPIEKNSFRVPVTLTIDCRSVPSDQLKSYLIWWYNPTTKTWVAVSGSKVDLVKKTVSAPLSHFSKYAAGPTPGKAGW